jgi:hypothetical protein
VLKTTIPANTNATLTALLESFAATPHQSASTVRELTLPMTLTAPPGWKGSTGTAISLLGRGWKEWRKGRRSSCKGDGIEGEDSGG